MQKDSLPIDLWVIYTEKINMGAQMLEMIICSMIGGIFGSMIANFVWNRWIVKKLNKWRGWN